MKGTAVVHHSFFFFVRSMKREGAEIDDMVMVGHILPHFCQKHRTSLQTPTLTLRPVRSTECRPASCNLEGGRPSHKGMCSTTHILLIFDLMGDHELIRPPLPPFHHHSLPLFPYSLHCAPCCFHVLRLACLPCPRSFPFRETNH